MYAYELLNGELPQADPREANFGHVWCDNVNPATWRRKAGWHAMRRYCALFRDPGVHTAGAPSLPMTLTAAEDLTLRTALYHRTDGRWLLCLQRNVDLYRWNRTTGTGQPLPVTPQPVTVNFGTARRVEVFEPTVQDAPTDTFNASQSTYHVGAGLLVLQIG